MISRSWSLRPLIGAALLLALPVLSPAQTPVGQGQIKAIPVKASTMVTIPSLKALPQGIVKQTGKRLPRLTPGPLIRGLSSAGTAVQVTVPTMSATTTNVLHSFPSTPSEAGLEPPDMGLAVGPNHVVVATNDAFQIHSLDGTSLVHVAWPSFIPTVSPPANNYADPEVVYDNYHDRWILTVTAYDVPSAVSGVWTFVSTGPDPTGGWIGTRWGMGAGLLIDFPRLGFNADTIYVSGALFNFSGFTAAGSKVLQINLNAAEAASPSFTAFLWGTWPTDAMACAQMHTPQVDPLNPTHSIGYLVQAPDLGGTTVTVTRLAVDWAAVVPYYFDGWTFTVGACAVPPKAEQPGSSNKINTGDCRLARATFFNGQLETAQTVGYDQGGSNGIHAAIKTNHWDCNTPRDGTGAVHWESMTRDTLFFAGGFDLFYPAVALNTEGDALFVVGLASATYAYPASLFSIGWRTTGFDGSLNPVKIGEAAYPYSRWGDYFGAALDPFDNRTVWVAGEYPRSDLPYGTWVAETNYKPMTTLAVDDESAPLTGTVELKATLTRTDTGDVLPGETVMFSIDGVDVGSGTTDGAGIAAVPFTVPIDAALGNHTIGARFDRTILRNASVGYGTLTVSKADTAIDVPDVAAAAGQTVPISATLTRTTDGAALGGQSLVFKVGASAPVTVTTNASGVATTNYTIPTATPLGVLPIVVKFAGDSHYNSTTGTGDLNIDVKSTITVTTVSGFIGSTVTLKATLKAGAIGLASRTVRFRVDGVSVGTTTTAADTTGIATMPHVLAETIGAHVLTAEFDGDGTYAPAKSTAGTLTVKAIVTMITVTNATATPGGPVNLVATLKAGATPLNGKTLNFKLDGTATGSAVTNALGVATLPHTATESAGVHTLTVSFAGDSTYAASTKDGTLTVRNSTRKRRRRLRWASRVRPSR